MFAHPEALFGYAADRQRQLFEEAEQQRLLAAARRARQTRAGGDPAARDPAGVPVAPERNAGNLAACRSPATV